MQRLLPFLGPFAVLGALLVLPGCSQKAPPSPAGHTLFSTVLVDSWPQDKGPGIAQVPQTEHKKDLPLDLADGVALTVTILARDFEGGSYLNNVDIVVASNTDYVFGSASGDMGQVFNKGTPEAPVMAIPVLVNHSRDGGRELGTTKIEVAADGTVSAQ